MLVWVATCHAASATDTPAAANMIQVTLSLLLIVGLLFGFSYVVKKFGLGKMINSSQFPVKVIGAISIGSNQRLMVIEVGDEWIVLGITPQNMTTITSMPRQVAPAANEAGNLKFASWMHSALEKYQSKNNDQKI
jgi:flagellar protein FliO/FliZ